MYHRALVVAVCFVVGSVPARGQVFFARIGDLPGGAFGSQANGVSGDGAVVVGMGTAAEGRFAVRWTAVDGLQQLPSLTPVPTRVESTALATSNTGTVIVGSSEVVRLGRSVVEATRWVGGIPQSLVASADPAPRSSVATGVSGDGQVVIGNVYYWSGIEGAFKWTSDGGVSLLPNLDGTTASTASAASDQGQLIVGASGNTAVQWINGEVSAMPVPVGYTAAQAAVGCSSDGVYVCGYGRVVVGDPQAILWGPTGAIGLGALNTEIFRQSWAVGVSDDGAVVVGKAFYGSGMRSFIWRREIGMRETAEVLAEYGIQLGDFVITDVTSVSRDGKTISGFGLRNGLAEGWVAHIPSPSSVGTLGLAVGLWRRRNRDLR